jgi:hypothetical protein
MAHLTYRPAVVTLLVAAQLAGCTEWRPQSATPQDIVASGPPRIRVTRTDSMRMIVDHPSMLGDTLIGQSKGRRTAIPVDQVAAVAVRRVNGVNTALLVIGLASAVGIAACAASDCGPPGGQ